VTAEMRETSLGREPIEARSDAPLRIALFSNQELIRAGLTSLLGQRPERVEVFEPAGVSDAHDIVVFDLVTASGEARGPALRHLGRLVQANHVVVAVTRDGSDELATRARALGCADVIPLSVTADELLTVLEGALGEPREAQELPPRVLTKRETEIVELIARGLSNSEIASTLFLSVNSVKTYIRTAYRKMGVTTRSQAVLWAVKALLGSEASHERRP
jgi:DNA-binding NarL/FixJ family response regulator